MRGNSPNKPTLFGASKNFFKKWTVWIFYCLLYKSWRIQKHYHPDFQALLETASSSFILAHWHGDELAVLHLVKDFKLATMASQSKDGQLIRFVIHKLGGSTTAGSSSRGAVSALKGLVRLIRAGHRTSMAVDGPRGPLHQVKPGVFELAKLSHCPIISVGVAASTKFVFKKSWNKALLPLFFSKVVIVFSKPLPALGAQENPREAQLAKQLANSLFDAQQEAQAYLH